MSFMERTRVGDIDCEGECRALEGKVWKPVFNGVGGSGGTAGISSLSDHSPVMLTSNEGTWRASGATWILACVQTDNKTNGEIEQIWQRVEWQSGSLGETMVDGN